MLLTAALSKTKINRLNWILKYTFSVLQVDLKYLRDYNMAVNS